MASMRLKLRLLTFLRLKCNEKHNDSNAKYKAKGLKSGDKK